METIAGVSGPRKRIYFKLKMDVFTYFFAIA